MRSAGCRRRTLGTPVETPPTRAMSFAHAIREKSWPQRDEPVQSLTSPPVDFDLSQLGDDLLGQFFVSA